MAKIPLRIQKSINKYEPVEYDGLTLYPISVSDYDLFLTARPAIEFMQQSFKRIEYISLPLLSAFYAADLESILRDEEPSGLFSRALLFLALALRLAPEESMETRLKQFKVYTEQDNPALLKSIRCLKDGEEQITITPTQFQTLRPILAAQNGIELPSDTDNPELVEAERIIAEQNAPKMDLEINNMITSVCALSGTSEDAVYDWAILKLTRYANAYRRMMDYIICGIGESQGTKWKNGNPCPSPWFDKIRTDSGTMIPIEEFAGGNGVKAMEEALSQ